MSSANVNAIIDLTDAKYNELKNDENIQNKLILIVFHADWCGPCKNFARVVEQFVADNSNDVLIWRANIDGDCYDTAQEFGVDAVPTMALMKNGKKLEQKTGSLPLDALQNWINSYL